MTDFSVRQQRPELQAYSPTQPPQPPEFTRRDTITVERTPSDQAQVTASEGNAEVNIAFWGGDDFEVVSTIPKIHGLAPGDSLSVSGTGVSGEMDIKRWNNHELSVETQMEGGMLVSLVEQATGSRPTLKNGKMNLAFQVVRSDGKFNYFLKDANSPNNKTLMEGPVEVSQDSKKKKIRLKTSSLEMTLNIEEARASSVKGSGSLSMGFIPIPGFNFAKK